MEKGQHFGFPFYYGNQSRDLEVEIPERFSNLSFTPSVYELEPHAAALGAVFYRGNLFPEKYRNQLFVAEHGDYLTLFFGLFRI